MTFLRWLFESGWHFAGVVVLIAVCADAIADIVKAARGKGGRAA
jgi:hypothetical protein